jgi:hypothetical protein
METEIQSTPQELADALLLKAADAAKQQTDLIAALILQRAGINEALAKLGYQTPRKRKPGRPVGSKTRKTPVIPAQPAEGI